MMVMTLSSGQRIF